jgi:hypothetical protein
VLEKVFKCLHQNHLKVNLEKWIFRNREVSYLRFTLTPEGIKTGRNKLQAIRDAQPPTNIKIGRSFVGLSHFFRTHIKDFAIIAAPLFKFTRKDSGYKNGPLPPDFAARFQSTATTVDIGTRHGFSPFRSMLHANNRCSYRHS